MRYGMVFPNTLIFRHSLKTGILISLCCYIAMLSAIELMHDHHEHAEHTHSGEACAACAACFYSSQHVGEEIVFVAFTAPLLSNTVLPIYEVSVFLPLRLTTNTRSRAPPVFSNKPANFAI